MMLWMAGTEQSASGVSVSELNACITRKHFLANEFDGAVRPRSVDCGETVLNSKRRCESLHDVAEVRALIGEPLQNRDKGGEVLNSKYWP